MNLEQKNIHVININIKEVISLLLHKLWIIIIVGIAVAGVSLAISLFLITPLYISSTSVYVINRHSEERMTLSDLQIGTQLTKDYMYIVKSKPVTEMVIETLGLDISNKKLSSLITVNSPEDTRILEITVKHPDPTTAKLIVDAVAKISAERMVCVMNMESVNVVEEGEIPTKPSTPNVLLNTVAAGMVGVVSAGIIITLCYYYNDCIRTSDDIERYLGISTLGIIPLEVKVKKEKWRIMKSQRNVRDEAAIANSELGGYRFYE